jgi:hypothetical protein
MEWFAGSVTEAIAQARGSGAVLMFQLLDDSAGSRASREAWADITVR